jgi:hypothetical protein
MPGNWLVPFLEGLGAATPPGYSAGRWKRAAFLILPARGILRRQVGIPSSTSLAAYFTNSGKGLYYYPKVIAILKGVVRDKRNQSRLIQTQLREDELVTRVLEAIEFFFRQGKGTD